MNLNSVEFEEKKYYINLEKIIYREIDGETYIFDTDNAMLHYFDRTATVFFGILLKNTSFSTALLEILALYSPDLHTRVREDYWRFCEELIFKLIICVEV